MPERAFQGEDARIIWRRVSVTAWPRLCLQSLEGRMEGGGVRQIDDIGAGHGKAGNAARDHLRRKRGSR